LGSTARVVRASAAPALVLACFLLASAYAVLVPAWEAPDEPAHFAYVLLLVEQYTLPVDHPGALGEEHQPPLYYLLNALTTLPANLGDATGSFRGNPRFIWAGQGGTQVSAALHPSDETFPYRGQALGLHLARETSVVLGVGTVSLILALGRELFPEKPLIGLLGAALAAFDPQFLFISGAVNNDNLLTFLSTGACWQMLRTMKRPAQGRQWLILAAWIALAVLTKLNALALGLVAGVLLVAIAARQRSIAIFLKGAGALLLAALVTAWWFARNQVLYRRVIGWTMDQQNVRPRPVGLADLDDLARVQFQSFWGMFGWMNVAPPTWFDLAIRVLVAVGAVGLVWLAVGGGWRTFSDFQKAGLAVLALEAVVVELSVVGIVVAGCNATCYQGRLLFPAIGPLMLFLALGLTAVAPKRTTSALVASLALVLAGTSAYLLVDVIRPAYPIVPLPTWQLRFVPNPTDVTFGQAFRLRGYQASLIPDGSRFQLVLFWQAVSRPDFDYSVSVHLLDATGKLVAQKDQAPGADRNYPPTSWISGDVVADEHQIDLPRDLPNGAYRLQVGVYNWKTGQTLPAVTAAQPAGGSIVLEATVQRQGQRWLVQGTTAPVSPLIGLLAPAAPDR